MSSDIANENLLTLVRRARRSLAPEESVPNKAIGIEPAPMDGFFIRVVEIASVGIGVSNHNGYAYASTREDVPSIIAIVLGNKYGGEICCFLKRIEPEPNHWKWAWVDPQTWLTRGINGVPGEQEFFTTV